MYTKTKIESLVKNAGGYVNSSTASSSTVDAQWVVYPEDTKKSKTYLLQTRTKLISALRKDGWTVTTRKDYGRNKVLILKTEIKAKK